MTQNPRTQPTPTSRSFTRHTAQQTLMDHLRELRARLFWIVAAMLAATSFGYFIQDQIMAALMSPLGGQHLVYLTPIGGFNFIFKVSLYFGIGAVLPVIIYHLYRFLEPLMDAKRKRSVAFFSVASFLLAVGGACFAYFGSLPAALHFLTGFNIQNVSAMLTVDSYLAFVVTYVIGFAALFQIPLVLMIINTIKPIPPKKLLGGQRFVILAAFIIAAVISPTPDITNQAILAVPIILMYQIGVVLVWLQSRTQSRDKVMRTEPQAAIPKPDIRPQSVPMTPSTVIRPILAPKPHASTPAGQSQIPRPRPAMVDIVAPRAAARHTARPARPIRTDTQSRPTIRSTRPLSRPASIDGIVPRRTAPAAN